MRVDFCKHYVGIMDDTCAKSVRYDSFTNGEQFGIVKKIPCMKKNGVSGCPLAEWPTTEEVSEHKKEVEKHTVGMMAAIALIKEKHSVDIEWDAPTGKNEGARGTIECPVCKGKLGYSIASLNGHIWGACSTEGCLSWMM